MSECKLGIDSQGLNEQTRCCDEVPGFIIELAPGYQGRDIFGLQSLYYC